MQQQQQQQQGYPMQQQQQPGYPQSQPYAVPVPNIVVVQGGQSQMAAATYFGTAPTQTVCPACRATVVTSVMCEYQRAVCSQSRAAA